MKILISHLSLAISVLASSSAFAKTQEGFYLGAGLGITHYEVDRPYQFKPSTAEELTTKVHAGYQFNRIIAAELTYTDYGKVTDYLGIDRVEYVTKPTTTSLSVNLGYSFDNGWRPFALLGISSVDFNESEDLVDKKYGVISHWGIGAEYALKAEAGFKIRLMLEGDVIPFKAEVDHPMYNNSPYDKSLSSFSVGLTYQF